MPDENGEPTEQEIKDAAKKAKDMARGSIEKAAARGNPTAKKMTKGVKKDERKEQRGSK